MSLTFEVIVKNIADAMEEIEEEEITKIHNKICAAKIKYLGNSQWEYTGENDNE